MQDEKTNIDEAFRRQLEDFSAPPPPHVWDNIQERLNTNSRRRKRAAWFIFSSVFITGLAFFLGYTFSNIHKSKEIARLKNDREMMEKRWEEQLKKAENPLPATNSVQQEKEQVAEQVSASSETISPLPKKSSPPKSETTKPIVSANSSETTASSVPLIPKHAHPEQKVVSDPQQHAVQDLQTAELLTIKSFDFSLVHATSFQISPPQRSHAKALEFTPKIRKWAVSAWFMPTYVMRNAGRTNQNYSPIFGSDETRGETPSFSWGAGMEVGYYLPGGRWSIRTGIAYNEFTHTMNRQQIETKNLNLLSASDSLISVFSGVGEISGLFVNPNLSGIEENAPELNLELMYGDTLRNVAQTFGFVEVPLSVGYQLSKGKFGFRFSAGLSASLLVKNKTFAHIGSMRRNLGETRDIRSFGLNGLAGVAFSYELAPNISLFAEPALRYSFTNLSSASDISFHPLSIGLKTGLEIRF